MSAALLLSLLVACDVPTALPPLPDGARGFIAPPVYELWWEITLACSGRRASLGDIRWYVVPGPRAIVVDGERFDAYWYAANNTIVLAEYAMLDGSLVRHEMLHAVLGVGAHPRGDFLARCGGVVVCDERCVSDAGPLAPMDPALPRVRPEALEIDAVVHPQRPSRAQHGGHFTMTVTARNPRNHGVVVTLPTSGDVGPSVTFEYRVETQGGHAQNNRRAWDDGMTRFAAGEIKRQVFDFRMTDRFGISADGGLGPATYTFRGAYGDHWAPSPPTVTLSLP